MIDRETLARNIEVILSGDPCAPDALAGLFVELRQVIEGGLAGINRARETLSMGVELAYLHTRAYASGSRSTGSRRRANCGSRTSR